MKLRPTFIAEIVQRLPTNLGYANVSGLGGGCVWLDPNGDGTHFVWRFQWPADIQADLVSFDKPKRGIANSDLELAALVLHEGTFPDVCKPSA